jgi:hypothetical protein
MEERTINENRQSTRFPTHLKGRYFLKERKGKGQECVVINISLNGAGLEFYTATMISEASKLFLSIIAPPGNETISAEGIVRWVKHGARDYVCGIELTRSLDKIALERLGLTWK